MIKNTASQKIGAGLVSATDGSDFTSTVTVYVTIDAGTQAIGTVGSGICTHEGKGYHTYAPSQAETNGDLLGFSFTGTGAITATVQVLTIAGDAFNRLGAPAGASVSADVAAVKVDTAAILVDTSTTLDAALAVVDANVDSILVDTGTTLDGRIPAALVGGRIDANVGAISTDATAADNLEAAFDGTGYKDVDNLYIIRSATAQAGSATTITLDAGASAVDDFYNSTIIEIIAGTGVGQGRIISDYVGATKVATVSAWATNPASDSVFIIDPFGAALGTAQTGDCFARLGAPAGASVSADIAAVKVDTAAILVDTGTTLDAALAVVDSNVDAILVDTAEIGAAGAGLTNIDLPNQTMNITGNITGNLTGSVGSVTGAVGSVTGLTASNLDATVSSRATPAQVNSEVDTALADARLDELLAADSDIDGAAPPTVGSVFHELLTKTTGSFTYDQTTDSLEAVRDNMGTAQTGDSFARLGAPAGASVSADIAAIEAQTDDIGAAGAGLTAVPWNASWDAEVQSEATDALNVYDPPTNTEMDARTLPAANYATAAALDTVDNFLDTEIADILVDTSTTLDDMVDDLEGRLSAALATALQAHSLAIGRVVIDVGSTTTAVVFELVNGSAASAVNDFYNGRALIFTSGALTLQATSITDYVGATKTATVSALTAAPADDVTAVLV